MTDTLSHRGPNSDGFYCDKQIALGHRRLSIIDLSTSANQPFTDNENRYVLVFNGEIYNYQDIKLLLTDYQFKTTSDTEVILAAYIQWGQKCLQYLNGMFAFAIWDKQEKNLFIARDRLGVKPFYYYFDGEMFIFASEIRAILSSELVPRQLDNYALHNYLMFQSVYAPYTMVKGIFQLMPGECGLISSAIGIKKSFYWTIETAGKDNVVTDVTTAQKNVKKLLTESVQRRMISDVPLGAFLSGGIDSSAIVGLMSEVSARPIDTFTVVFDENEYDESYYANIVAKKFNTNHTKIRLTADDFLKALPDALDAMDAPSGDGLNTYIVSKVTKQAGVTVALSGLGGDELFGGYNYFAHYKKLQSNYGLYWKIPLPIRLHFSKWISLALPTSKRDRIQLLLNAPDTSIANIYPLFRLINTHNATLQLTTKNDVTPLIIEDLLEKRAINIERLPNLSHVSVAELLGYTLNVLLRDTDQFSMASALEVREPFFDFPLVEYVLNVPDVLKYDKNTPKSLLVNSLGSILPKEIINRPKMGFSFPWTKWLLTELKPFCESKLNHLATCSCFDMKTIRMQWDLFVSSKGTKISWVKIWQLVVLSHWLQKNSITC